MYKVSMSRTATASRKSTRWIMAVTWSTIMASSLAFNLVQIRQRTLDNVRVEATIAYEKDMLFRTWVAGFGGVYVPTEHVGEQNPYLSSHPSRDLTTLEGQQLTRINPAWMARQMHELSSHKTGTLGRITSLNALQSVDSPDSWERSALQALERGKTDTSSFESIDNEEYFRVMKPLIVEESCMPCHAQQGYVVGDIHGGLSISVPLADPKAIAAKSSLNAFLTHLFIWVFGMIGISSASRRIEENESSRRQALEALQLATSDLENQVNLRTTELKIAKEQLEQDIMERERTEEDLQQSKKMLLAVINSIPVRVFWKDRESVYLGCNWLFAKDAGLETPDQIVGKNDFELDWRELAELYQADDRQVIQTGLPKLNYEELLASPNVGNIWVQTSKVPLTDIDDRTIGVLGVYEDITERKQAEDELRKLNRVVEQSPVSVVVTNLEGIIEYVNPFFTELTGYSAEEAVGMHTRLLRSDDNPPQLYEELWATLTAGKTWRGEFHNKKKNGELFWEFAIIAPSKNAHGKITQYIAIKENISQRKATEEALKQSEQKLSAFFDNAIEGLYRSSADGHILYANRAFATIFGFNSVEELLGLNMEDLYLTPDQREETIQVYAGKSEAKNLELQMRRKDGTRIWVRLSCKILKDEDGNTEGYDGFVTDVTEGKNLAAARMRVEKLEPIGVLAAGIGHDFNNFLMEILLNASGGQIEAIEQPELRKRFAAIGRAVDKATSITRQLLTISNDHNFTPIDTLLSPLLKESTKFALHGTPVTPLFNLHDNLHIVTVDVGQINQVISNLILNARQAMPRGGVIQINAENMEVSESQPIGPLKPGRYVKILIADQGEGIEPDIMDKIFDPYFTTKEQGSGLGLNSCFTILTEHKGWITASSTVGQGSVFTFFLPGREMQLTELHPTENEIVPGSGRILIMDDEEEIRDTLSELLKISGYEVDSASDGEMALQMLISSVRAAQNYDAVILDLTVPQGKGGLEIINEIKELDPNTKRIICSGYITDEIMREYTNYGFDGVLYKPYSLSDITSLLAQLLIPEIAAVDQNGDSAD